MSQTPNSNQKPDLFTRVTTALLAVVAIPLLLPAAEPLFKGNLAFRIIVVVALVLPLGIVSLRRYRRRRTQPAEIGDRLELHQAADRLASAVKAQWSSEASRLGLAPHSRKLIDVKWQTAPERGGAWGDLSGSLCDLPVLIDEPDSHELVILGDASTGKSAAMVYLTLSMLTVREKREGPQPVPVLFPLADWDPDKHLEDWLIERLADQHPWLTSDDHGRDLPARLVREGLILPVLDALDEVPGRSPHSSKQIQSMVIQAVHNRDLPLPGVLISSRRKEFREAELDSNWLHEAVVIELRPLTPHQIRAYLKASIAPTKQERWNEVFAALESDSAVTEALSSPLVLALAPEVYGGTDDPAELTRFPDAETLTAHVLRQFAPTRFHPAPSKADRRRGRVPREQAMRWLQFLADQTESDGKWESIRWWELSMMARTPTRIAAGAIAFVLSFASVAVGGEIASEQAGISLVSPWWTGVLLGLIAGAALGTVSYLNRPPLPAETQVQVDGKHLMTALKSGVPIFIFATAIGVAMLGPGRGPMVGFMFAIPIAAMYALVAPDAEPRATNPAQLLRRDKRVGYVFGVAYGIPAFIIGLIASESWWIGAAFGITSALAGGLLYGAQWFFALQGGKAGPVAFLHLGLAVLFLAPRGVLPWHVMAFLGEAHERGILRRQAGGTYEFRHANVAAAIAKWEPPSEGFPKEPRPFTAWRNSG